MKRATFLAATAAACLSMSACASTDHVSAVVEVIASPAADAAAVKVEAVLATLVTSFDLVVSDPASKVDRAALAQRLADAEDLLMKARSAFDSREGGASAMAAYVVQLVAEAVPAGASTSARFAVAMALAGLQTYAASIDVTGAPTPPSAALVQARVRTDVALQDLRAKLPPPGT